MIKKIIFLGILFFITISNIIYAATPSEFADEIYNMGYPYGMTQSDKVKLERFINQYNITEEQMSSIKQKANEAQNILQRTGEKNVSNEDLSNLKNIAIETADIVDATVVFTSDRTIDVYKNGSKVDSLRLQEFAESANSSTNGNSRKLVYTGNNYSIIKICCVCGVFAVWAVITIINYKKKKSSV